MTNESNPQWPLTQQQRKVPRPQWSSEQSKPERVISEDSWHGTREAIRVLREVNQEFLFQHTLTPRLNPELEVYMEGFHPFMTEVMRAQLPEKWKWPKVDPYDRTSNPDAHVNKAYMTQANIFSGDLRVHCRLFPTTLKGTTLEWYYSLPQNLVDSFRTLCSKFIARFVDSKLMATVSASLHHVAQG